ncbi:MAG: arabinogalactan endo-1,4-beta-galactosidase [Flavobacterium sp. BFFFF1]|uniref:glycoside hydrolase family 53 protein n=1 Tax=unclassified Flavobacterium TaxID=196869 RepID=UPI000BDDA279|nr:MULTISPECIES: glycosyl hydrolase 53 family protein [unclassified Flavobacterium]OYU82297.1 MAG: arabinogalactan endo-1,4-beta-galactosidase [Flavobacterium sp. BFFFF1]
MKSKILLLAFFMLALLNACSGDDKKTEENPISEVFIRASDMSTLPEAESAGAVYKNDSQTEDALATLKNAGCNTIRIRLWKDPANAHSGMTEVKALAQRVKNLGMKVWLTVHYSDTWADPGNQTTPTAWQNLSFTDLKAAVSAYTSTVLSEIHPDIFQIGNETNDGFLWPKGKLTTNENQYLELVNAASATIRAEAPNTKIMLHFAGLTSADWFFGKVSSVDYDYIGLSYYPVWHGKSLTDVRNTIDALGAAYGKKVIIAETAYPFTLGWEDYTNNIVGLDNQLIPAFQATPAGQKSFLSSLKNTVKASTAGFGFAYWGGEWISFRGDQATNGSSFENQALWDFDNNALPVMDAFAE